MLAIIGALVPAVLVAAAVMVYVAYPYRGERMPLLPGLGEAMRRGVEALPTLEEGSQEDDRTRERRPSLIP